MLRPEKAVAAAAKALQTFETSVKSAEDHLESFLQEDEQRLQLTTEDQEFLSHIFHACLSFKKALKVILTGFYTSNETAALRSDRHLYQVLVYLAVLGLEDIGMRTFQRIVLTQHTSKMAQFLRFLFADEDAITGWMRDRWLSVYDEATVDEEFVQPMLSFRPEMLELIAALEDPEKQSHLRSTLRNRPSTTLTNTTKRESPPVTVPQPFNLTRPKPRLVPVPKVVSTQGPPKHKPIPKSTYTTPLEEEALERKREKNRRKAEQTARAASERTFACAPNPEDLHARKQQLQERKVQAELAQLDSSHRARPVPATVRAQVPVKLNAAAVLREEKQYRQQLEGEAQRLAKLEAGEFNERELSELEDKIKMEEEQQRLADIERKVLEGQLSREEAIIAREEAMEQKREAAMDMKEESRRLLERAQRLRQKEEETLRERAAEIQQVREQVAEAVDKALQEKRQRGIAVKAEREQLLKEAEERAAQEMAQRQEIIREIRALETVRQERRAEFDATETMNLGLMSEMSFAELRQRLDMLCTLRQEEEEARRAVIFDAKLAKDAMLQEKMEVIQQGRMQLEMERAQKQTQKKTRISQLQRPKSQQDKLDSLRQKLAARKAERVQRTSKAPTPTPTSTTTLRNASRHTGRRRTGSSTLNGGSGRASGRNSTAPSRGSRSRSRTPATTTTTTTAAAPGTSATGRAGADSLHARGGGDRAMASAVRSRSTATRSRASGRTTATSGVTSPALRSVTADPSLPQKTSSTVSTR